MKVFLTWVMFKLVSLWKVSNMGGGVWNLSKPIATSSAPVFPKSYWFSNTHFLLLTRVHGFFLLFILPEVSEHTKSLFMSFRFQLTRLRKRTGTTFLIWRSYLYLFIWCVYVHAYRPTKVCVKRPECILRELVLYWTHIIGLAANVFTHCVIS